MAGLRRLERVGSGLISVYCRICGDLTRGTRSATILPDGASHSSTIGGKMGICAEEGPGAVRAVMERYVEAVYTGDVETLTALFHPQAAMSGYLGDELLVGGPEPFLADLAGRASMADSGHAYEATISNVEVMGRAANATLVEHGFFGISSFVNYYSLLHIDGEWRIMAKTFSAL